MHKKARYRLFLQALFFQILVPVSFSCLAAEEATSLAVTHVSANPERITAQTEEVVIRFHLNQPAQVSLTIYDARNYPVGHVSSHKVLSAGDQSLRWLPRDRKGRALPPEAYVYSLQAQASTGETVNYDLTDITGGENVYLEDIHYDPETETLSYYVPKSARLFLRAGFENGFVVKTLVNGAVREAGHYEEHWNGLDSQGVIYLKKHPKLRFFGSGYRLSQNSLIVAPENTWPDQPVWLGEDGLNRQITTKRTVAEKPKGLNRHFYHPVEQCRDIEIALALPPDLKHSQKQLPELFGTVPLRVELAPEDARMMESERSEMVYFLDNQLLYENETSYFPYTWNWDTRNFPPGTYHLTAFIVGFKEHFGVVTHRVQVKNPLTDQNIRDSHKDDPYAMQK